VKISRAPVGRYRRESAVFNQNYISRIRADHCTRGTTVHLLLLLRPDNHVGDHKILNAARLLTTLPQRCSCNCRNWIFRRAHLYVSMTPILRSKKSRNIIFPCCFFSLLLPSMLISLETGGIVVVLDECEQNILKYLKVHYRHSIFREWCKNEEEKYKDKN
jgi:hypothetical protein